MKVGALEKGKEFTLKSLFTGIEWDELKAGEKRSFGRYFKNEVADKRIPNVVINDTTKTTTYKKMTVKRRKFMKRIISLLFSILTICTLALCMSGCGGASKSAVIGVWKNSKVIDSTIYSGDEFYMYVYEDGTGDAYAIRRISNEGEHFNSFEWEIDGKYFVKESKDFSTEKYTIDGDTMLDKQGKIVFTKVSNDTSTDIEGIH